MLTNRRTFIGALLWIVPLVASGQDIRNLLKTGPDEHCDLSGVELVKRKVRVWICMGGKMPVGREANFINDGPAAAYAVEHWPTPIVFSGWEIGQEIMTGAGLPCTTRNEANAESLRLP